MLSVEFWRRFSTTTRRQYERRQQWCNEQVTTVNLIKSTQEWVKHGSNTTRNESTINHDDTGDNDEEVSWIRHQYVSRRELVDQNDPLMLVLVASYVSRVRKRSELIGGRPSFS